MNSSPDFEPAFERARKLHAEGQLAEAEQAYRRLATPGEHREFVLQALVDLYMQSQRPNDAIDTLVALTGEVPDSLYYYARLASLLDGLGQTDAAISTFERLLKRQPELAAAHFDLALLYKKNLRYADALTAYENAVRFEIEHVQEVYSNMGVLYSEMRKADKAREMYERALEVDPEYVPALFNLAGLFEETGERQTATELYQQILGINPRHWGSLARLAYAKKITSADDKLIASLKDAIEHATDEQLGREGLHFALGKVFDDLGQYEQAFAAYSAANELGKRRNPPYNRRGTEQAFDQLISLFDSDWMKQAESQSTAAPIFICGMFRSGSTLIEQILAAHPLITAGGELEFLPWLLARKLAPYPQRAKSASREELQRMGGEYLSRLQALFPEMENITDKRPDNFVHLGLIRAMFPSARIIYTKREPMDNCLSVYFQQLGGNLSYPTDLENAAHYYVQHERLMNHWRACFRENIFTVDYDELVRTPEPVLSPLLEFLGLDWDDRCTAFQQTDSQVKTASVWQVREELHALSSGRWRNYESFVRNIQALLTSDERQVGAETLDSFRPKEGTP